MREHDVRDVLTRKRGSSLRSVTYVLHIESVCVSPCKSVFAYARTRCQRCFDSETGFIFAISDLPAANRINLRQAVQISVCVCENRICQRCFDSETGFFFALSDIRAAKANAFASSRANQCLRMRGCDVSDVLTQKRGSQCTYILQIESICVNRLSYART
jgi:hypothetical protein